MGANHGTLTDKANELWMQQPGGGFLNQAAAFGVTDPLGPGRQVTFLDVNHDPFPDLYVTNHAPRPDGQPSPNRLFINQNGASFRDAPEYGVNEELGGVPGNQSCAHAVDYNKDGWEDLFVCDHSGLRLYRNNGGVSFTDVTSSVGIIGGQWRNARMADLNGDGWLDIVGLTGKQFRVQIYSGAAFGPPSATRTLIEGRYVATGDVNFDERLECLHCAGGYQSRSDAAQQMVRE